MEQTDATLLAIVSARETLDNGRLSCDVALRSFRRPSWARTVVAPVTHRDENAPPGATSDGELVDARLRQ